MAEGRLRESAFDGKVEFLIKVDRGRVVSEHIQFQTRQVEPFVREVYGSLSGKTTGRYPL